MYLNINIFWVWQAQVCFVPVVLGMVYFQKASLVHGVVFMCRALVTRGHHTGLSCGGGPEGAAFGYLGPFVPVLSLCSAPERASALPYHTPPYLGPA